MADGGGDSGDRLAAVQDELRAQGSRALAQTPFLPLESNPDIMNAFAKRVGLLADRGGGGASAAAASASKTPTADGGADADADAAAAAAAAAADSAGPASEWAFCDVWGLDAELLAFVPRPVAALVLLFPCSRAIYSFRAREDRTLRTAEHAALARDLFFVEQHAPMGNACGTIAATHAIANATLDALDDELKQAAAAADTKQAAALVEAHQPRLARDKAMARFVVAQRTASPAARGAALMVAEELRESSDGAASDESAQTALPSRDADALDHHFCAFVRTRAGLLVELDGTKRAPVIHDRDVEPDQFLERAIAAVRRSFVDVDPDNHEFSLMALARVPIE